MAGTITGLIEAYHDGTVSDGEQLAAQEIFKNLYDFLNTHTATTRIALSYGTGTGTDYHDGANPFGTQAFAVFRWDTNANRTWPWYLFIAVGNQPGSFTSIPWRPGGTSASTSAGWVVMSAAVGVGGDENPWNGTTNNDGTDTVPGGGTDMWTSPSGGGTNVKVIPASNSTSGSGSSEEKKEVMDIFSETSASYFHRVHMVADDDALVVAVDERASNSYKVNYLGVVDTPNPNLSHPNPLVGFTASSLSVSSVLSLNDFDCGVTHSDDAAAAWEATEVEFQVPNWIDDSSFQPNEQTGVHDAAPIDVIATSVGHRAFVGQVHALCRWVGDIASEDTDNDLSHIVVGQPSANTTNMRLPWDGTTTPATGVSRTGISF